MNAIEIANVAYEQTEELAKYVSPEVRELAAFGKIAQLVGEMGEGIPASSRIYRLEEAMHELKLILGKTRSTGCQSSDDGLNAR